MSPSSELVRYLGRVGPSRAPDLQRALGVSQSTFQRAVAEARPSLLVVGRGRATWYAARRDIEGLVVPLDVWEIDEVGASRRAFTLHPVQPFGCYVEGHVVEVASGFHETDPRDLGPDPALDIPWFLHDLKPAGFLGRGWCKAHAAEGYPVDPIRWTGDHVLRYAAHHGVDLPGALVLGAFAKGQLELGASEPPVAEGTEADVFPELASRALHHAPRGSSAGGDQPKFAMATTGKGGLRWWIVKFSPPLGTAGGRRWADLLAVEHLAHEVLRAFGVDSARSRLVDAGGRRFLQVERFDRHGARGRSGLVSLLPLDRDGVASDLRRWSLVTRQLLAQGRLSAEDHERVRWLEAFGQLVANTDMHPGNLSLRLRGTTILGVAPLYDMLPMFHAPRHGGELPRGLYTPQVERSELPATAREAARVLWSRALDHYGVSDGFKRIAEQQRALC